jgi:hypothetical protein
LVACGVLGAGVPAQEPGIWFVRGAAGVRIAGPAAHEFAGSAPGPVLLPAGDYAVHFAAGAAGKPESLRLPVPDGAAVAVAVERVAAGAPAGLDAGDALAGCFVAGVVAVGNGSFGLAARLGPGGGYRFVWDRAASRLLLERSLGGAVFVLASAPAPVAGDGPHHLALQAEGFRLRAWLDDALVLEAMDGAHVRGGWGTWSEGAVVRWRDAALLPVRRPLPSAAIVTAGQRAEIHAATAIAAGHHAVLELALDRPHAALLRTEHGSEVWLLRGGAAPRVLLGDLRGALGRDVVAAVPAGACVRCELRWPRAVGLAGQFAMARLLVVSPAGDRIVATTPAVPLRL